MLHVSLGACPALPGQGNAFPLPLPVQGAFELGEGPHDGEHEVGHGGVLAGEDQTRFDELHPHPFAREALDESTCWAAQKESTF